jgi:DNA polymerase I-like protein with 3'-5' exonuclease and polymerase domains
LEAQDIHTALSVHDELVIVAPTEKADEVLATTIKEMTVMPSWAPDLPLDASGFVTDHYGKG